MKYIVDNSIENFPAWSGAVDTLNTIKENNLIDELDSLLDDVFQDKLPTLTEVNDFLRFDNDFIYEQLGIKQED